MSNPSVIWRQHQKLHNFLGKTGKLLVWTKISISPLGFEHEVPYFVGIIKLDPSASSGQAERMPVQIVDCIETDLKINQKVKIVIRKIGKAKSEDVIEYGIKVKPI